MKYELKDWLKSINESKNNLTDEDPTAISSYLPYIINKCLSGTIDSLMYANEMNKYPHLSKQMQYDFYINSLRKRKRFSPWINKKVDKDLECVKSYYGYSDEKASQALKILSPDQINFIKKRVELGGLK
jgi:hypothetical protein